MQSPQEYSQPLTGQNGLSHIQERKIFGRSEDFGAERYIRRSIAQRQRDTYFPTALQPSKLQDIVNDVEKNVELGDDHLETEHQVDQNVQKARLASLPSIPMIEMIQTSSADSLSFKSAASSMSDVVAAASTFGDSLTSFAARRTELIGPTDGGSGENRLQATGSTI